MSRHSQKEWSWNNQSGGKRRECFKKVLRENMTQWMTLDSSPLTSPCLNVLLCTPSQGVTLEHSDDWKSRNWNIRIYIYFLMMSVAYPTSKFNIASFKVVPLVFYFSSFFRVKNFIWKATSEHKIKWTWWKLSVDFHVCVNRWWKRLSDLLTPHFWISPSINTLLAPQKDQERNIFKLG